MTSLKEGETNVVYCGKSSTVTSRNYTGRSRAKPVLMWNSPVSRFNKYSRDKGKVCVGQLWAGRWNRVQYSEGESNMAEVDCSGVNLNKGRETRTNCGNGLWGIRWKSVVEREKSERGWEESLLEIRGVNGWWEGCRLKIQVGWTGLKHVAVTHCTLYPDLQPPKWSQLMWNRAMRLIIPICVDSHTPGFWLYIMLLPCSHPYSLHFTCLQSTNIVTCELICYFLCCCIFY